MATKKKPTRKPAKKRAKPAPAAKSKKLKKPSTPAKAKARPAKPAARKLAAKKPAKRPVAKTAGRPAVKRAAKAAAAATPAPAPAPAPAAPALPPSAVTLARVLDALHARTGNNGGDHAAADVRRYREANGDVDDATALFVRALPIKNWYVNPDMPDENEIEQLWISVCRKMDRAEVPHPGGWNKESSTSTLNRIAREALQ